jgi:hypothetical protein
MSHFGVLVIGDDVEEQLRPYHEFECTGDDDQYVVDIDETEEERLEYQTGTRRMVKNQNGDLFSPYDDQFYRDPTEEESKKAGSMMGSGWGHGLSWTSKDWGDGRGYRAKVKFVPDEYEEVEVPYAQAMSFLDFLTEWKELPIKRPNALVAEDDDNQIKFGYVEVDENDDVIRVIRRTNPNSKWDWWELGGRWKGFLKLKDGANGNDGRSGLMGSCYREGPMQTSQTAKGNIDFEGMRKDAEAEELSKWDKVDRALLKDGLLGMHTPWRPWGAVREENNGDIDLARQIYQEQSAVKAIRAVFDSPFFDIDQFLTKKDDAIENARNGATTLYAFVKDGVWVGKGEMGWWGMSSDDESQDEWNRKVNAMLDALPDDTLISVIDCHT